MVWPLEKKEKLRMIVKLYPGIYLEVLSNKLNVPKSTCKYYIDKYIEEGTIIRKNCGRTKRLYSSDSLSHRFSKSEESVISIILINDITEKDIIKKCDLSQSRINRILNDLNDREIIISYKKNHRNYYKLNQNNELVKELIKFKIE